MNTSTSLSSKPSPTTEAPLGKCDSCKAQGAYVATKGTAKLTFCAHHVRSHEASLLERSFIISPSTYKF